MTPGRSGGRSLAERAVESGVRPPALEPGPAAPVRDGEGRHCWVHSPPGAPGTWPGLLVEWRQREGRWEGRVAYTVSGPLGSTLVEGWLPAAQLQPR